MLSAFSARPLRPLRTEVTHYPCGGCVKKRKWSKEKIVREIRVLSRKGEDLSAAAMSRKHVALFSAASCASYFRGWKAAIRAAGLSYDRILAKGKKSRREKLTLWDRKRVLREIKRAAPQSLLKVYRSNLALYSAGRREFGSWEAALKAGGYRLRKSGRKNSNLIVRR